MKMEKGGDANWGEELEDPVTAGDTQGPIPFLRNLPSNLQATSSSSTSSSDDLRLASALCDLASSLLLPRILPQVRRTSLTRLAPQTTRSLFKIGRPLQITNQM